MIIGLWDSVDPSTMILTFEACKDCDAVGLQGHYNTGVVNPTFPGLITMLKNQLKFAPSIGLRTWGAQIDPLNSAALIANSKSGGHSR